MSVTDWNLLRTLLAVSDAGTLTGAAEVLKTTQPTVGRHIRELEALLGETLFDRLPGGMRPTSRATELLARLGPMRQGAAAFTRALGDTDQRICGSVRVTASRTFGDIVLAPVIARLMAQEPGLQIELVATDRVENLSQRDADIAIRFFRPHQPDLIVAALGHAENGLFAHESYLAVAGVPHGCADLRGKLVGSDDLIRTIAIAGAAGFQLTRDDFRFRSDSVRAQLAAIEQGIGPGALWTCVAKRRAGLRRLFPELVLMSKPLWLCAHDDLRRSHRLRRVFDFLATELRGEFMPTTLQ